jgi:hypothetical protein
MLLLLPVNVILLIGAKIGAINPNVEQIAASMP